MSKITLETKQVDRLVRKSVIQVMRDILQDPDFGLEIQDWVKKRLTKKPKKLIPLSEIQRKYL